MKEGRHVRYVSSHFLSLLLLHSGSRGGVGGGHPSLSQLSEGGVTTLGKWPVYRGATPKARRPLALTLTSVFSLDTHGRTCKR